MKSSTLVITHGGTGAIITAVKAGKKVIAVPRLAQYGEHVDDHQLQLLKQFDSMNLICPCWEINDLRQSIDIVMKRTYNTYESNTQAIIDSLIDFIEEI